MLYKTKSAVTEFYSWICGGVKKHAHILRRSPKLYHKYLWLNLCIWKDEIHMRLFGSKTNYELCVKRWEWLMTDKSQELRNDRPDPVTHPIDFNAWIEDISDLKAEIFFAYQEANHHRTGAPLSWRKDDMSDEDILSLPDWWFSINKYKRMRMTNGKTPY